MNPPIDFADETEKVWLDSLGSSKDVDMMKNYVQGDSEEERSQFLINQTKGWLGDRILAEIPIADDTVLIQNELSYQQDGETNQHVGVQEMKKIDGTWKVFHEYN
jgi:hypothetical protein